MALKNKRILKNVAKDWSKSILMNHASDAFDRLVEDCILSEEEVHFILGESVKIGDSISLRPLLGSVDEILNRYFDFE